MSTDGTPNATSGRCPRAARRADSVGSNLALVPRAGRSERVDGYVLVDMYGLGMLAEVVQSGKAPRAVALEWALPGVFPE